MDNFNKEYLKLLYQQYDDDYDTGGWGSDVEQQTAYILDKIQDLKYQIKNGNRGSLTGIQDKEQLKQYLKFLGQKLAECAEFI